ncbi:FAD-dependent oxidoreductase [Thalassoroseus pseudoceratinae]|uniref:FAD-dependent oxidoreductase n=1 Tax=Thalassoroseus pseudoceratinae TaxID=2713176 RepID=UPI00198164D0|nr:FAD-dependent oxidoreductase [Thalassoroseus pseudoceratinae]
MRVAILFHLVGFLASSSVASATESRDADVVIYGATPSGIAAAIAAADSGQRVRLVEPTARIGGLVTSGLSHTDFHSFESLTGTYLDFSQRVEAYYAKKYGRDSQQVRDSFRGTFAEPHVNLAVFQQMLAEWESITVSRQMTLDSVQVRKKNGTRHIQSATFLDPDGAKVTFTGRVFIDATYEGDLLAKSGVPWRCGREGRDEFQESLAPEDGDVQLQAYNFRFIMTRDPANRVAPEAPAGYRREDFLGVLPILKSGRIKTVFGYPRGCLFKAQTPPLPNGKYDINDVSGGLVRLSLPGKNLQWPDGDAAARAEVFAEHRRDQVGLLYFLQHDAAVPEKFRNEAQQWGWCRDEFAETDHLPPQLYVREARRMVGVHVFRQQDSEHAPGDARAVLHRDAIAMGDYGNNCHGTAHEGPRFGGHHTGEFYNPVPPYQIPYGTLLPKDVDNLLVPVAVSATHVGFCALRLEPIWMSLGQAAGHAASMAIETDLAVQKVDVAKLQRRLHTDGSATIYASDVLPGHPDFAAVQWWGTLGGLHGLAPMPAKPGQRGEKIHGQYFQANPGHKVELNAPLDDALKQRWQSLFPLQNTRQLKTRGDWIRKAFQTAVQDAEKTTNQESTSYPVTAPPAELKLPKFYQKYVSANGFPIVSSDQVNDYALKEAAYLADLLLAKRPDVRDAMINGGSRLVVIAHDEFTTDVPEYAHMKPKDYWDARARGLGGSATDPLCSCGEENLLAYPGDPYQTESILIHEFAHNIHLRGLAAVDPSFDTRVKAAYDAAMKEGLWAGKYASTNHHEYFAEGVQSWFDNNRPPDHDHNHVDTRKELREYDPRLAKLCEEVFGETKLTYTKPATRLNGHLQGYDPQTAPTFRWPARLDKQRQEIRKKAKSRPTSSGNR